MWRNPDFGKTSGGTNYMPKLEGALRAMLDHEKNGVETTAKNDVHYGSKFYEPEAAKGGALSMAGDWITKELAQRIHKSFAKATSEGNLRALSFNGWCCQARLVSMHTQCLDWRFVLCVVWFTVQTITSRSALKRLIWPVMRMR